MFTKMPQYTRKQHCFHPLVQFIFALKYNVLNLASPQTSKWCYFLLHALHLHICSQDKFQRQISVDSLHRMCVVFYTIQFGISVFILLKCKIVKALKSFFCFVSVYVYFQAELHPHITFLRGSYFAVSQLSSAFVSVEETTYISNARNRHANNLFNSINQFTWMILNVQPVHNFRNSYESNKNLFVKVLPISLSLSC